MDPIAILQSRIEQLEAKLGINRNLEPENQQGDTVNNQLFNSGQPMNNVPVEHEKLHEAEPMPSELNNYAEPYFGNFIKTNVPVLEPEPIVQLPAEQAAAGLDHVHTAAADIMPDAMSQGYPEKAAAASITAAAEPPTAAPMQLSDLTEPKAFPRRRNGLD